MAGTMALVVSVVLMLLSWRKKA